MTGRIWTKVFYMTKTRIRGVYKHPSGGYIARLRFRGISTSKTFSSMASAERWMNQTKGGLETGDVVVYQGDLLSKEQAEARSRAGRQPHDNVAHRAFQGLW